MASSEHTTRVAARSKRAARLARWRFRLTAWAVVLAALGLSIRYDRCLSAWAQEHLRVLPNHVLVSFRDFGQITPVIAVTIALACYDRRRRALVPFSVRQFRGSRSFMLHGA